MATENLSIRVAELAPVGAIRVEIGDVVGQLHGVLRLEAGGPQRDGHVADGARELGDQVAALDHLACRVGTDLAAEPDGVSSHRRVGEASRWPKLLGVDVPHQGSIDAENRGGNLTQVARSAHVDTFTRDNLPPPSQWPEFLFTLPELQYPPALNCATELLDRHVQAGAGARRCLLTDTEEWSYAELLARSNQVARALVDEMGLVPGNRVLLRGPNNPWLVASWLGVIKAGGVAVATMPLLRQRELETMIEIAEVGMAICDHRFHEDLFNAAPEGFQIFTYGGEEEDDLTRVAAKKQPAFKNVTTAGDDVCMLAFTSGTT
ncbi:MAG: hypothetical protein E6I92_00930, partial [Chloroflexi bacterium]